MKKKKNNLHLFKQIPSQNGNRIGQRLSLGEYRRAVSWSKFLISSGAEIKERDQDEEEEWSADMSQLFIGSKFASGRHSRIYRGIYKRKDVAIKMISQPQEDESLANFLEKQFTCEVALLFGLEHPNIITVRFFHNVFVLVWFGLLFVDYGLNWNVMRFKFMIDS